MSDSGTVHVWICPKCPTLPTGEPTSIQLRNLNELVKLVQDLFRNGHHKTSLGPIVLQEEEILQNVSKIELLKPARVEKAIA